MTAYHPLRKGTLLIFSGSCEHLHIICNDPVFYPNYNKESILVVNISSIRDAIEHDPTCIFNGREHPFIKHPSYVYYNKADILGVNTVCNEVDNGNIKTHQNFTENHFNKILEGFSVSKFVTPKIKRFYEKYCL